MKSFVAFFALIAVAACRVPLLKPVQSELAQIEAVIATIQSPSTDPATAVLLEEQLQSILGGLVSVGPAIVDFPLPDGGAISAPGPVGAVSPSPSPVVIGDIPTGAPSPLVQIIVNVNGQPSPVVGAPVDAPTVEPIVPGPVNVVDAADVPVNPIQVATPVIVDPIQVATPVIVDPIQVATPVIINPVEVGSPVIPVPAIVIPDILN